MARRKNTKRFDPRYFMDEKADIGRIVEWGDEVELPDFINKLQFTSPKREIDAAYNTLTDEEKALVDADPNMLGRMRMIRQMYHKRATDPMHSKSVDQKEEWMKTLKDKYIDVETIGEPHHGDYAGKPLPGGQLALSLDYEVARETGIPEEFVTQVRRKLVPQDLGHHSGPPIGSPEHRKMVAKQKAANFEKKHGMSQAEYYQQQKELSASKREWEREDNQKKANAAWDQRMKDKHGQLPGGASYLGMSSDAIEKIEKETERRRLNRSASDRRKRERERGERLRNAPPADGRAEKHYGRWDESISRKKLEKIIKEEIAKLLEK